MPKQLILIIEDEVKIRSRLAEAFLGDDYPVETAENGQKALELLRNLKNLPALIFLDLMMPVMDGQTFLIEIQKKPENKRFKDIPVAIVSAARIEIYGSIVAFLRKPPELDQLLVLAEKYADTPEIPLKLFACR